MPETKLESVVFTAVTAWIMVYIMTLYNTVLAAQSFTNITFLSALKGMWVEYVLIFLCAFFISGKLAKKLAFRVVKQGDRPVFIIFCHSDIHSGLSGGFCKHHRGVSRLWLYRKCHSRLSCDLLQKFCYGSARSAVYCGACRKAAVQKAFQKRQYFGKYCGITQKRLPYKCRSRFCHIISREDSF